MSSHGDAGALVGKPARFEGIDIARGTAMLLVFLAHYIQEIAAQVPGAPGHRTFHLLELLTTSAAPAFVFISGFTLAAVLARTDPSKLRPRKLQALDRALFMLVVGHAFLFVTDALLAGTPRPRNTMVITDTIAISIMLGLLVLPGSPPRRLAWLALLCFAGGWWLHLEVPHPGSGILALGRDILFGLDGTGALSFGYPVLQWFAWFLVGALSGMSFSVAATAGEQRAWGRRLAIAGALLVALTVALRLALKAPPMVDWLTPGLKGMIMVGATQPPGPVYFGVFGGVGIVLMGLALQLAGGSAATSAVAVLGRASLFVFLLQSPIYRDIVSRLPLQARWTWPTVFVLSVVPIWLAARAWDARGGNRWFRLGLVRSRGVAPGTG